MGRNATDIALLASRLKPLGFKVSPKALDRVLHGMREQGAPADSIVDLAVTAFCMRPMPAWLMATLRPSELQIR